jgi:VWFA-related protein
MAGLKACTTTLKLTMRHLLAGSLALLIAGTAMRAQQSPTPTFRVQVDAIEIDAFVTDAQGNPVTGLTANDFQILEDGKPQVLTSFSQVNVPFERRAGPLDAVQADVQSNNGGDGRLYLFVLDEVAPDLALRSRAFLRTFLDRHFAANDRGAVVFLGHQDANAAQMYTSNPRLLLAAFDRFSGIMPSEQPQQAPDGNDEASARAAALLENFAAAKRTEARLAEQDTMADLKSVVETMAGLHGRRKALLLFSSGLPPAIFRALSYQGGVMTRAEEFAHAAVTAATRGNVTIYPVNPAGLATSTTSADADRPVAQDRLARGLSSTALGPADNRMSLAMLADATGGFAVVDSNRFAEAFDRIVRENSTYYLLGFTSSNEKRDGKHRRVQIRVTRPGLQVRSREGYIAPLKNERLPEPVRVAAVSAPLSAALTNPLADGAVPIRVFAAAYRREAHAALVAIAAEIDPSALDLVERDRVFNGRLELGFLATDARGKVYQGEHYSVNLGLKAETYELARQQGLRVLSEMRLSPGRYQLRLAAGNPVGKAASVVYDLLVPDFSAAPLMSSGIALTSAATSGAATLAPKDPLKEFLPRPVTARREFDAGDTLAIFGEVYDNASTTERAPIDVRAELRAEDGRIIRTAVAQTNRFTIQMPLAGADAGRYVVHVEAHATNGKPGTVGRDIPIRVR